MEYLLYYLLAISTLLFNKINRIFLFCIIWFIFIGLRDGIGVDWYSTIEMFNRSIISLDSFQLAFQGYQFLDSEIIYKIISTIIFHIYGNSSYVFIVISLIEILLIYKILYVIPNSRIGIVVFLCLFSLHYPMNAVRQGLCLISICSCMILKGKLVKKIGLIIAMTSHWASIPLIFLIIYINSQIRKFNKLNLIIFVIMLLILLWNFYEIILLRFNFDGNQQYNTSGFGLKFLYSFIFTILIIYLNKNIFNNGYYYLLISLYVALLFYQPLMRYFYFFTYFIAIYSLINFQKIELKSMVTLIYSFSLFLFEWHGIYRFESCVNCGEWFPYINKFKL